MSRTMIIAEAGVNHNGDIELAKKLIEVAAEAGVDYVKFQTFVAENLVSSNAPKADYQVKNTKNDDSQLSMLKKLELTPEMHKEIIAHCNKNGIKFLSTAFDLESIDFLNGVGLDFFKIPSGEVTNLPYLEKVAKMKIPVVMSTGMCNLNEVRDAVSVLLRNGVRKEDVTVLHCNTDYPTAMSDVNLNAMLTIANEIGVNYGYSDHTLGIEIPIAAVALGASVIEKHFTLDKNLEGPDHLASLEPNELIEMVKAIRNIEVALGSKDKKPSASEQKNIAIARKSIVASRDIGLGEVLSKENITVKRPGSGISPMKWYEVIGSKAEKAYKKDDLI